MTQKPTEPMPDGTAVSTTPKVGEEMPDGTVYVGISPATHQPMYAAPADAPTFVLIDEARKYSKELKVGDKQDFRVPLQSELDVLFQNREKGALKGTFNLTDSALGFYISSTTLHRGPGSTEILSTQRFSTGDHWNSGPQDDEVGMPISLRCIRSDFNDAATRPALKAGDAKRLVQKLKQILSFGLAKT